jgi:putative spermidine/putrescine transport system permease protein
MTRRTLFAVVIAVGFVAPVLHTVWVSFSPDSFLTPPTTDWSGQWYRAFLKEDRWTAAVGRSLLVASLSATLGVLAATPAAYAANRFRFRGRRVVPAVVLLPACLPPAALGLGVLPVLHLLDLWGSLAGVVLVHATLALPAAFLIVRSHLTGSIAELEAVARGLGANGWTVVRRVTLPLLRPALLAGWVAGFVLSLNESVVTLFVAGPESETLPVVAWPQLKDSATPLAGVASVTGAAIGTVGLGLLFQLMQKK